MSALIAKQVKAPNWWVLYIARMTYSGPQLLVITMTPAIARGWNFGDLTVQGADDWPDMGVDDIGAWLDSNRPTIEPLSGSIVRRAQDWALGYIRAEEIRACQ